MNYFELYEIPVSFNVDNAILKKKYFEISKKYHPDFFSNENDSDKENALEISTLNTNALNILSDFNKRMKYVLELKGVLEHEEKFNLPQSFLMEMMDLNETILELPEDIDLAKIESLSAEIEEKENEILNEVKIIIQQSSIESVNEEELKKVKAYYFKKKYLDRLKSRLKK